MTWMWDAFEMVLQPQPLHSGCFCYFWSQHSHSGMVCTLTSTRMFANSSKLGGDNGVSMHPYAHPQQLKVL